MLVNIVFDYYTDVINVPDNVGKNITKYQQRCDRWLYNKLNDLMRDEKIAKISEIYSNLPDFQKSFDGKPSVSKYALLNVNEFISECIAEGMAKRAGSISKKVTNIILGE